MQFITTDLDVKSEVDLTPLVNAFEEAGLSALLSRGEKVTLVAVFEVALNAELENEVAELVSAIDGLHGEALCLWEGATKVFNFGYTRSASEFAGGAQLPHAIVEMIANRGASITVTVYKGEG